MAIYQYGNGDVVIQHPAFSADWWATNLTVPEAEYSLEFATFINRWALGYRGTESDNFYNQNFRVSQRKASYGNVLIDVIGFFTPTGQILQPDIKTIFARLIQYMQETDEAIPNLTDPENYQQITELDRILLKARVTPRQLGYLYALHLLANTPTDILNPHVNISKNLTIQTLTYEGTHYFQNSALRNKPTDKRAMEHLIRLRLVDLTDLPKSLVNRRQGKDPVGVTISAGGQRFFELYSAKFDPQLADRLRREQIISELQQEDQ